MSVIILACGIAIGLAVGCFLSLWIHSAHYAGKLKFQQDEDGVYPYVEGIKPLDEIRKKDYILLEIAE